MYDCHTTHRMVPFSAAGDSPQSLLWVPPEFATHTHCSEHSTAEARRARALTVLEERLRHRVSAVTGIGSLSPSSVYAAPRQSSRGCQLEKGRGNVIMK